MPYALRNVKTVSFTRSRIFLHNLLTNQILAANDYLRPMALVLNQLGSKKTKKAVDALIIVALGLFKANPLPSGLFLALVFRCFTIWVIFVHSDIDKKNN